MSVIIHCECGAKLQAKAALAGKRVPCPKCGRELTVPNGGDALPSLPEPVEEQEVWAIPTMPTMKPKASAKSPSRKKQSAILLAVFVGMALVTGASVGVKTWLRNQGRPVPELITQPGDPGTKGPPQPIREVEVPEAALTAMAACRQCLERQDLAGAGKALKKARRAGALDHQVKELEDAIQRAPECLAKAKRASADGDVDAAAWWDAHARSSFSRYVALLRDHPDSPFASQARAAAVQHVERLKVDLKVSKNELAKRAEAAVRSALAWGGAREVTGGEQAVLRVQVNAHGLSHSYGPAMQKFYTGASLSGSVSLTAQGVTILDAVPFGGIVPCPAEVEVKTTNQITGEYTGGIPYEEAFVRSRLAAIVRGALGDTDALIAIAQDKEAPVREGVVKMLGQIGGPAGIPIITAAAKDTNFKVRTAAMQAMAQSGTVPDERSFDSLVAALKDPSPGIRRAAASMLGKMDDPRAVPPLVAFMKTSHSPPDRETAVDALARHGRPAVEALLLVLKDKNTFARQAALKALGKLGDPVAVTPIVAVFKDDRGARKAAGEALAQLGEPAVEPLLDILKTARSFLTRDTAEVLGKLGDKRAVEPLIAVLRGRDMFGRIGAAKALGDLGDKRAIAPLKEAAKVRFGGLGKVAQEALKKLGAR